MDEFKWPYNLMETLQCSYWVIGLPIEEGLNDRIDHVLDQLEYQLGVKVLRLKYKKRYTYSDIAKTIGLANAGVAERICNKTIEDLIWTPQYICTIYGETDTIEDYIEKHYPDLFSRHIASMIDMPTNLRNILLRYYPRITVGETVTKIKNNELTSIRGIGGKIESKIIKYFRELGVTDADMGFGEYTWHDELLADIFRRSVANVPKDEAAHKRLESVLNSLQFQTAAKCLILKYRDKKEVLDIQRELGIKDEEHTRSFLKKGIGIIRGTNQLIGTLKGEADTPDQWLNEHYPDRHLAPYTCMDRLQWHVIQIFRKFFNGEEVQVNKIIEIVNDDTLKGLRGIGPYYMKNVIDALIAFGIPKSEIKGAC